MRKVARTDLQAHSGPSPAASPGRPRRVYAEAMSDPAKEVATKIQALLKKRYGSDTPQMQKLMFQSYDKNQDDRITDEELARLLSDAGIGNGFTRSMWVSGVMEKLNQDKDSGISWDEYERALSK